MLFEQEIVVEIPNIGKKCSIRFMVDNFGFIKNWYNVILYKEGDKIIFLVDGFRFIVCNFNDAEISEEAYRYLNSLDVIELWNIIYKWLNVFLDVIEIEVNNLLDNIKSFTESIRKLRMLIRDYHEGN